MISKLILFLWAPVFCFSQTLKGKVIDASTNKPIETVTVYFDNTTVGTTTNQNGEFSMTYTDAIQSSLVISYLGYEKVLINNYRDQEYIKVYLKPASVVLDEVNLDYDDGLTRKQKLRLFKREFLGTSKYGKACKILNENALILRYDKNDKILYASSKVPLKIHNKALRYEIKYDLMEFYIEFRYVNVKTNEFSTTSVTYYGTTFFKNLEGSDKKRIQKNRKYVYKGSVQHFMRALFHENIKANTYEIFYNKLKVDEWAYFNVSTIKASDFKQVTLKKGVSILYNKKAQSEMHLNIDKFYVDVYGNYTPIIGIYFSGAMGNQRVGDTLPSNYDL